MNLELVFGLRGGKITHISEVESGLDCACICPNCGKRLVAKKGDIRIHHFAHEDDSDCQLAVETSLHIAAKEILQREMKIKLPFPGFLLARVAKVIRTTLEFEEVKLEKRFESIIPDLIVFKNGKPLIIEIKVTHPVDDAKLQKITELGFSAIEVDLSRTDYSTMDSIKQDLIWNVQNKRWLYNREEARYRTYLEKQRRLLRLDAYYMYDKGWYVWECPLHFSPRRCCNECADFLWVQQNNQIGNNYRRNPDYVYCGRLVIGKSKAVVVSV